MLAAEGFEKVAVSGEAILAGNRVFEEKGFKRVKGESHIGAEKDKEPYAREVGAKMGHVGKFKNSIKSKLTNNNSHYKCEDVGGKDRVVGEFLVGVEYDGDKNNNSKKT